MSSYGSMRIEPLGDDNYRSWQRQMKAVLTLSDLWEYVSGEDVKPELVRGRDGVVTAGSETGRKNWLKKDEHAKSLITLALRSAQIELINDCDTSKEIWDKLQRTHVTQGPLKKSMLIRKLAVTRLEEGGDVKEHLNELFATWQKLKELNMEVGKELFSYLILLSLSPNYEVFCTTMETHDTLPDPEDLRIKIIECRDSKKHHAEIGTQNAMAVKKKENFDRKSSERQEDEKKPFPYKCHKCGKLGHKSKDCRVKFQKKQYGRVNNSENSSLFAIREETMTAEAHAGTMHPRRTKWCLDSGCTSHLCQTPKKFIKINSISGEKLQLASNSSTSIKGKGTASLTTEDNGILKHFNVEDAYYVPDLRMNLLSVGKITDKGMKVIFKQNGAEILDKNNKSVIKAKRFNGLYYIQEMKSECNSVPGPNSKPTVTEVWHRRLGHLNLRDLQEGSRKNTIQGIKLAVTQGNFDCEICIQGKMTMTPFPKREVKSKELLEIIHTDVWGPAKVESNGKAKLFVTFIDEYSGWCVVRLLKNKSEVFNAFKEYKAQAENHTGKKIKYLQSDNGREYINHNFDEYLKINGITRRLTVTHTPQQNGMAERKNRTLVEMARCMLIDSQLPKSFWGEAINTANYTRNRCPSRTLNGKTPHEIWTGKAPNIKYFRKFGCEVYTRNREPNQEKFESRAIKGILVGYSEEAKAYRVWIQEKRKIDITRDVKLINEFGGKTILPMKRYISHEVEVPIKHYNCDTPIDNGENNENWFDAEYTDEENVAGELHSNEIGNNQENEEIRSAQDDIEENFDHHAEDGSVDRTNEGAAPPEPIIETKRGRGRPQKIFSGFRGRPAKQYHTISTEQEIADFAGIAEIPIHAALNGPDADEWINAMALELKSLMKNDTWTLVDRPKNHRTIGSRVILRNKYNADGTLEKRKARVVARGFAQRPGIDFDETFAPVARQNSIRMIASLSAQYDLELRQLDIMTAYLNGTLEEEIYMEAPEYLEETLHKVLATEPRNSKYHKKSELMLEEYKKGNKVCKMKKALYGLRQAGRNWHLRLTEELRKFNLTQSQYDPCVYYFGRGEEIFILAIYVDDILIASKDIMRIEKFEIHLSKSFEVKKLGNVKSCLGIEFTRKNGEIQMHQRGCLQDVLERFGMEDSKPVSTPIDSGTKLQKPSSNEELGESKNLPYRELVGSLMYLATSTRPDIAYAVSYLSQYNSSHTKTHWIAAKRVLRYLKGTPNVGLRYRKTGKPLTGYVDADWGNCVDDRRSYTGYVFILGGSPISWESRKQRTVALSSTEAEYMALTEAAKESVYLQRFLRELGYNKEAEATLFCDNNGAQKLSKNPVFHSRTKHIDVRHHFVREILQSGRGPDIAYISTDEMTADLMTKGLSKGKTRTVCSDARNRSETIIKLNIFTYRGEVLERIYVILEQSIRG